MEQRRKVYWVYQKKLEGYVRKYGGWVPVEREVFDAWERWTYDYHELLDSSVSPDRFGNFGSHIIG